MTTADSPFPHPPTFTPEQQQQKIKSADVADMSCHPGHRRYVGGIMDGHIAHLVFADPSDYPQTVGTILRDGQRSWYELDYEASVGTEVVYRFVGLGRTFEDATGREGGE